MKPAIERGSGVDAPPAFRISRLNRVSYGSKAAEVTIEIVGLGSLNVDFFEPDGKPPFVAPAGVRDHFTGDWKRTFRLADACAAAILDAVLHRLGADADERVGAKAERQADPSSAVSRSRSVERSATAQKADVARATARESRGSSAAFFRDQEDAFDAATERFDEFDGVA